MAETATRAGDGTRSAAPARVPARSAAGPDFVEVVGAAAQLGRVYGYLVEQGDKALGWWIEPKGSVETRALDRRLLLALNSAYGSAQQAARDRYAAAYGRVIPALAGAMARAAAATLVKQEKDLMDLSRRLRTGTAPEALHAIARDVDRATKGFGTARADIDGAVTKHGLPEAFWAPGRQFEFQQTVKANTRARVEAALLAATAPQPVRDPRELPREEAKQVARVLSLHPRLVNIMSAYAESPMAGTAYAQQLVIEAVVASRRFATELSADSKRIWRYPPLIVLGVHELGLGAVEHFPEFATALGPVMSADPVEWALSALGVVVMVVGIVFTGPLAVAAIGAVDLAVTGASGILAYLRENEQNMAADGSSFRAEGRLAENNAYGESAIAGLATLVAGIALVFSAANVVRQAKRLPMPIGGGKSPNVKAPRKTPFPRSGEQYDKMLDRATEGRPHLSQQAIENKGVARVGTARTGQDARDLAPSSITKKQNKLPKDPHWGDHTGTPRWLDPQQLQQETKSAEELGAPTIDPLDYNAFTPEELSAETTSEPLTGHGGQGHTYDEKTLEAAAADRSIGVPKLEDLERANAPGRIGPDRRVITSEQQLYGIPDGRYLARLRKGTPTDEMREWAQRTLKPGMPDPVIPSYTIPKPTKAGDVVVHADHIVAKELIMQFPGFAQLSFEDQLAVLNSWENIMPVSKEVNLARGSQPYARFTGIPGHPIPPALLADLQAREKALSILLQRKIDDLLRAQTQARGLPARPPSPPPALLLLWRAYAKLQGKANAQDEQRQPTAAHSPQ